MTDLASWNDTATRAAIEEFVARAEEHRVAVFDNDGTLWCEKPMPIQLDFIVRRWAAMAERRPGAARAAAVQGRLRARPRVARRNRWSSTTQGDDSDLKLLLTGVAEAFAGTTVDDYAAQVDAFFAEAEHPTLGRPYRDCGYKPMVELLRYLEANGFGTYIASGGDRDFMRGIAGAIYGIPPERVIGSSYGLSWEGRDGSPTRPGSTRSTTAPRSRCGSGAGSAAVRRSAAATRTATSRCCDFSTGLRLLVVHDDAEREFDYTAGAEDALARGYTTISVKHDWATVFA